MAKNQTLVQRIALDGGEEIKRELLALGKAGEQAFKALDRQAKASKAATTGLSADIMRLRTSMVNLGSAVQKVGSNFSFLGGAIGSFAGVLATAFSAQAFIDITSQWTDLTARITNATGSAEVAADTMQRLGEIARRTYNPLRDMATTFADNSVILTELNVPLAKQLDLQEALANAMVLSGAKGEAAEQIMRAFTNTMAEGALRGEDLNNVLKKGSFLVPLIAKELGVGVDELKKLGAQGRITAGVLQNALLKNFEMLRKKAEEMPATIQDAFTLIQNALFVYIGTADQASGVSRAIADALIVVADNMHIVIPAALALASAFLLVKAVGLARDLIEVGKVLLLQVLPAIVKVTLALARNPFGLAAIAVAALIVAIIEATGGFDNFGRVVGEVAALVMEALAPLVTPVLDFLKAIGGAIKAFAQWIGLIKGDSGEAAAAAAEVDKTVQETTGSLGEAGEEGKTAGASITSGMEDSGRAATGAASDVNTLTASLARATAQAKALAAEMAKVKSGGGGGGGSKGSSTPAFAGGGPVRGPGSGTSDSILARLSNGEFVMRAKAVRKWGLGMLNRLNQGLPAFATGGLVSMGRASIPAFAGEATPGVSGRPLTLVLDGQTFGGLIAPEEVAGKLANFATERKVRSAGRKPDWYK